MMNWGNFLLCFLENSLWHFMQTVFKGGNMREMSKTNFSEKVYKNIFQNVIRWNLYSVCSEVTFDYLGQANDYTSKGSNSNRAISPHWRLFSSGSKFLEINPIFERFQTLGITSCLHICLIPPQKHMFWFWWGPTKPFHRERRKKSI